MQKLAQKTDKRVGDGYNRALFRLRSGFDSPRTLRYPLPHSGHLDMTDASPNFAQLGLCDELLMALSDTGYERPSPIQAQSIPPLLAGRDLLGQAQTGTGKTAAFALPILHNIDLAQQQPQALILAPTRELAIQVAEALQRYAQNLKGFRVLPVYGGQGYSSQIRA